MSKHVKNAIKVFVVTFLVLVTAGAAAPALVGLSAGATLGAIAGAAATMAAVSSLSVLVGGLLSKGVNAGSANFDANAKVSTRNPSAPRQLIYGECRVGGTITHIETGGTDNSILKLVIVLAGHRIQSLENIIINDEELTTATSGNFTVATNSKYTNTDNDNAFSSGRLIRFKFFDGSQSSADSDVVSNSDLSNNDKFNGIAYVFMELVFDSEAFGGGIPPLSFHVKGKRVFDPRDTNQTLSDASTHTFSDNPALHALDYITDTVYGLKAVESEVNLTDSLGSFKVAANTCDSQAATFSTTNVGAVNNSNTVTLSTSNTNYLLVDVGQTVTGTGISGTVTVVSRLIDSMTLSSNITISDGTTLTFGEKAYTSNGFTDFSANGEGVLSSILSAMAGRMSYVNGKFTVFAGASGTASLTIEDENILEPIQVISKPNTGELYNTVKAAFVDANRNFVATDSPVFTSSTHLTEDTPSGESSANYRKELEIQLPFTTSVTMAQRIARTQLLHSRQDMTLSVLCNVNYMKLQPFDYVQVTNERLSFTNKNFEVLSVKLELIETESIPIVATRLQLKEIDNSVYTFATSDYIAPNPDIAPPSTGDFSVSAPTNLSGSLSLVNTGYEIDLNWTNNTADAVAGTEILYGTSSNTYTGSFTVGKGTAKAIINEVKPALTYFVCVRHFTNANVYSAKTSEISITVSSDITTPSTPTSITATTDKALQIALSWTNPNNTDLRAVKVYRSTSSGFTPDDSSNLVQTVTSQPNKIQKINFGQDDGLVAGTTYYFKLKAVSFYDKESSATSQVNGAFAKVAAAEIADNTITATQIASNTITADRINVTDLVLPSNGGLVAGTAIGNFNNNSKRYAHVTSVGSGAGFYIGYVRLVGGTGQVKTISMLFSDGTFGASASNQINTTVTTGGTDTTKLTDNASSPFRYVTPDLEKMMGLLDESRLTSSADTTNIPLAFRYTGSGTVNLFIYGQGNSNAVQIGSADARFIKFSVS